MNKVYKFSCEKCGYFTGNSSSYKIHLKTQKHNNITKNVNMEIQTISQFDCDICNKTLTSRGGLWKHKQTCKIENHPIITDYKTMNELTHSVNEIKNNLPVIVPQQISNTTNNTQNNNNNINITMYLNEHCSGAIDFMDFMKSIQIDQSYREKMLANGFVKTICSTIKETLDQLPMVQRPIHYIEDEDENQQIIHIRDNNEWRKETELQWTSQIHDYYSGELPDDTPTSGKKKIFFGLKQLEDNILEKIAEYYSRSVQFKVFERDNQSEMNYVPNKLKIIKYILENVKIDKNEIVSMIETP